MSENKRLKQCNLEKNSEKNSTDPESGVQELSNSEDVTQSEDGMSTLVAKILIESITDVELLKKFRFINKYWNCEACVALRKLSITSLTLSDGSEELEDFLVVQNSGRSLSLPSPLKNLSVDIHHLSKYPDNFSDLLNSWNLKIKSLLINVNFVTVWRQLNVLLKSKETEITDVECTGIQSDKLREAFSQVKLRNLQGLHIMEFDCRHRKDNCDHVELFRKVTIDSPLSRLTIRIESTSCFSSFLNMDLTRIKKLVVSFGLHRFEKKYWDLLASVQLPSLEVLLFPPVDNDYLPQLRSFYRNISSTVKNIQVGSVNVFGTGVYPKLKSLTSVKVVTSQDLKNITQERFPQLTGIEITFHNRNNLSSLEISPVETVQTLYATCPLDSDENTLDEDYPRITIATLAKKFPNVKNFQIQFEEPMDLWTSSQLLQVYQAYPDLNSFSMCGDIPLEILAGGTMQELKAEWPMQNFPRMLSIVDFQSLESLHVEQQFYDLSNESIQYCFARLPSLKHLKFPWNEKLSLEAVRDFLQHLLTLEISNSDYGEDILMYLRTVLPRTTVQEGLDSHTLFPSIYK